MILYHVLNRGVDKRTIFQSPRDYKRFVLNLYLFNDANTVLNIARKFDHSFLENISTAQDDRDPLVIVHAFCLMPNHYHMILSPVKEGGISLFMKKINMGYAKYFNEKNKRTGALFQGKYKGVPIQTDRHFSFIPYYVHFNPLDLFDEKWRSRSLDNIDKALSFLENYEWSSHHAYIGKEWHKNIVDISFFQEIIGRGDEYIKNVKDILKGFSDEESADFKPLTLE